MTDSQQQQQQQQKPQEGLGPDEMWAPGGLGPHRELPVDVPDTLLQKAYPNKVKNRSSDYRNEIRGPRSASDLDLSLNLKNDTLKSPPRTNQVDERARIVSAVDCTDVTDATCGRQCVRTNGQPPMLKIELKIESENLEDEDECGREKKREASKEALDTDKYRNRSPSALSSPDLKNLKRNLKDFEEDEEDEGVNEDSSGQKESSVDVDVEEDYPFAKEDYPTMLKTCSDDSASPRSSSGRSDSTAPLDSSLVLRHAKNRGKDSPTYDARRIDLGSPCRPVVPEIKVAPLFGRARDATSFDNPAYGLADLQDLQGLLMRSDEVSDLTRLIDEQCAIPRIPRDPQDRVSSPGRSKDQHQHQRGSELAKSSEPNAPSGKSAKSSKPRRQEDRGKLKAKTRSLDVEELIRAGSSDDLLGIESGSSLSSSSRQRPKKKRHQQISSGYSTLRSDASTDLEHVDRSFLVVGGKTYREVAVDCPPDFVPVTKCHPVYPPPNKTPGSSKHNTLEPKRERNGTIGRDNNGGLTVHGDDGSRDSCATSIVASPCVRSNDLGSFVTLPTAGDQSIAATENVVTRSPRTLDRKHEKKVRSKVKSLFFDSFFSIVHHETRKSTLLHASATSTSNRSDSSTKTADRCSGHVCDSDSSSRRVLPISDNRSDDLMPIEAAIFDDRCNASWCDDRLRSARGSNGVSRSLVFSDLGDRAETRRREKPVARGNPQVRFSYEPSGDFSRTGVCTVTFSADRFEDEATRGNNSCSPNDVHSFNDDPFAERSSIQRTPVRSSFVREADQNCSNSLRELSRGKNCLSDAQASECRRNGSDRASQESPNAQNFTNSRLSLEYKRCKVVDVDNRNSYGLGASQGAWKSETELPTVRFDVDRPVGVQCWRSESNLFARWNEDRGELRDSSDTKRQSASQTIPCMDVRKKRTYTYQHFDDLDHHQVHKYSLISRTQSTFRLFGLFAWNVSTDTYYRHLEF